MASICVLDRLVHFLSLAMPFLQDIANGVLEVSVQQSSKVGYVEDILRSSCLGCTTLWLLQIEQFLAGFVALGPHQVTDFKRVLQAGVLLYVVLGHLCCVTIVDQRVFVACEVAICSELARRVHGIEEGAQWFLAMVDRHVQTKVFSQALRGPRLPLICCAHRQRFHFLVAILIIFKGQNLVAVVNPDWLVLENDVMMGIGPLLTQILLLGLQVDALAQVCF